LSDDFLGAGDAARQQNLNNALEVAKLYTVFVTDDRAKQLLELWERTLARKRTTPGSPIDVYAQNEALRAFVEGIRDQIAFATTEGRRTHA